MKVNGKLEVKFHRDKIKGYSYKKFCRRGRFVAGRSVEGRFAGVPIKVRYSAMLKLK